MKISYCITLQRVYTSNHQPGMGWHKLRIKIMEKHTITVEIEAQDAAGAWHYPLVDITVDYEPEQAGSYAPGGPDAPEGAHIEFVSASLLLADELVIDQTGIDTLAADYVEKHSDYLIDQIRN